MEYYTFSDKGNREYNEDSFGVAMYKDSFCFVVADGLGGHGGGDIASKIAVDTVCGIFEKEGYYEDFFENVFNEAQKRIISEQEERGTMYQMKTTIVVLVINKNKSFWAHIGDSRLYLFSNKKYKKRTIDHSVPQLLVLSGEIKEKQIRNHPDRNRLMRVLGVKGEKPQFDFSGEKKLRSFETYLLCTDGFWELINEKEMESSLKKSLSPDEWIDNMNMIINERGKNKDMDNYTAIVVWNKSKGLLG